MNVPTELNVSSIWEDGCTGDTTIGSIGTSYSHSYQKPNSTAIICTPYYQHKHLQPTNSIVIIIEEGKIFAFLLCLIALIIGAGIMTRSHTYSVKIPLASLLTLVPAIACAIGNAIMLHILLGNFSIIASALFLILLMPLFFKYNFISRKLSNIMLGGDNIKCAHGIHGQGSFLLCCDKREKENNNERSQILQSIIETKKQQNIQTNEDRAAYEMGEKIIARRNESLGPNVSAFYADEGGLVVTRGEGCYLLDPNDNKYLDCCNNVAAVGHSHPRVVEAGISSLSSIQTNSRFLHPAHQRYIDKLLQTFPPELNTVYLVNSGSEANDLALRIARAHADIRGVASKPRDIICLDSAYHGHTQSLVEISPYKWYQATDGKRYQGKCTHVASLPDSFRGEYRGYTEETGLAYAKDVQDIVRDNHGVGVFIAESVVGCGGQVELPPTYLKHCYDAVREYGGVTIADEVQTGFGRSGQSFWYFQTYDVVPDIVTFGKPVANGYPVGGVVCRREVAESFAKSGIEYFNTYGGNSVACTVAESVLDVIEDERLMDNAKDVGEYMLKELRMLMKDFDVIGDVRGRGLFLGVEFVSPWKNKNDPLAQEIMPDADLCKFVVDYLRFADRIIISRDGPDHNVIKIKPPLVFGRLEADKLVSSIRSALSLVSISSTSSSK